MFPLSGKNVAGEPLAVNAPARLKPADVAEKTGVKVTADAAGPWTLSEVVSPGNQTAKLVGLKLKVASPIVQLPREMTDANDPVMHTGAACANPGSIKMLTMSNPLTRLNTVCMIGFHIGLNWRRTRYCNSALELNHMLSSRQCVIYIDTAYVASGGNCDVPVSSNEGKSRVLGSQQGARMVKTPAVGLGIIHQKGFALLQEAFKSLHIEAM